MPHHPLGVTRMQCWEVHRIFAPAVGGFAWPPQHHRGVLLVMIHFM